MPQAIANSYITECAKKEKSTLYGTTYEQYNDTYHKRFDVYDITCKVCGDHIEYRNETTKEKHTMKNGKCTVCGYEEEPEPLDVVVSRNQANAQVGDSIGATAEITGGSGSYLRDWTVTCDGETITTSSNNESEFNWIATKAGSWKFKITVLDNNTGEKVSDTSSAITVAEAECTHENTTETLIDTEYIQKNENHHTVRSYYRITCGNPSCGAILNPSYYKDADEAHAFGADGNCEKCGYVPPTEECDHQNTASELLRTGLRQCDSDNDHYSVVIYKDVCADCGVTVKEEREVITLVPHEFVDGVCACGFAEPTPECDHATMRDKISTVLEQYSDTAHRIVITYHVYCDCGQVDYEEEIESFPEHQFDSNGLCECGYQKIEEISISFSIDKTTVAIGEDVTFTITTNAATIDFVADGTAYNTVEVTGGSATYVRAFTEQGDRQIKFVAPDGTSSDTETIHVTAKGQLDQTTISIPASADEGNDIIAFWTAVDHAENYVVRLYDDVPTELWEQETADTAITIPGNLLEADKHYTVSVIATGTDYTQSESTAGFIVAAQVSIGGSLSHRVMHHLAGEGYVTDFVRVYARNANLTRVAINIDDYEIVSQEISGTSWDGDLTYDSTVEPLNEPGIYTFKLIVTVDAGEPNWKIVDQVPLYVDRITGSFDQNSYTIAAGESLNVYVNVEAELATLDSCFVYIFKDGRSNVYSIVPINGSSWSGVMTLSPMYDSDPLNVPGTYCIDLRTEDHIDGVYDSGNGTPVASATLVVTAQKENQKLADPVITSPASGAELDSDSFTLTWNAVDGADHYVYAVRDTDTDELIYSTTETTSQSVSLAVPAAGHSYRAAVGAVPVGESNASDLVGWGEVTFSVKEKKAQIEGAFVQNNYTMTGR